MLSLSVSLAACGGGGSTPVDAAPPDAPAGNSGFVPPTKGTKANMKQGSNWVELGDADWSCLGTPTDQHATTQAIMLSGHLTDFQNGNPINGASIIAFPEIDYMHPVANSGPTDPSGAYSVTLPTGHVHWGFEVTGTDYMPTFLLNQYYDDATAAHMQDIAAISNGIAAALPALIGLQRTPGTGVLAGAIRDCSDHEVSNAVATVSSTSMQADHLSGAVTYYLDKTTSFPVRHDQLLATSANGLFAVFQLPATATAYIQVWGYKTDAEATAGGQMTLLSELQSPVVGDTVITGSLFAVRTN